MPKPLVPQCLSGGWEREYSKAPAITRDSTACGFRPVRRTMSAARGVGAMRRSRSSTIEPRRTTTPRVLHEPQAQQHRIPGRDAVHAAAVDARIQERHAKTPGVLLQCLHRVEAHGLVVCKRLGHEPQNFVGHRLRLLGRHRQDGPRPHRGMAGFHPDRRRRQRR